jgi:Cytochrome C assembly protein
MFDLEERIRHWRQAQAHALGGRVEVLDELESHLREEMQRLVTAGQAPASAWETALARLGDPRQLAAEFGKVSAPGALTWVPARVVVALLALLGLGLAWMIGMGQLRGQFGALLAGHVFTIILGYLTTFAVGFLAIWALLSRVVAGTEARQGEGFRAAALALAAAGLGLTGVGVVLGGWWAADNLGRFWGWDAKEIGGLSVLVWNAVLLLWLRYRPAAVRVGMVLAGVGNVVVSLSWFGPALLDNRHSYGFGPPLLGFVIVQVLLLLLALVPAGWLARQRA